MKKVLLASTGLFILDVLLMLFGLGNTVGVLLFLPAVAGLFHIAGVLQARCGLALFRP